MPRDARIFVAGHRGLVGSSIVRRLQADGAENLILRTRQELDLTDQAAVHAFYAREKPAFVFDAAAKVGGILANDSYPAEFLYENLAIQTNLIHGAWRNGVRKFCFIGSSCIYPKLAPQPLREESLLTGPLEPTNEWYAIAKIAGIKMCQAYRRQYGFDAICLMPTNMYGPGDNYDLQSSHVLPALIRKFHDARIDGRDEVVLWGTGSPLREFLHVDDFASAAAFLMDNYSGEGIINIGSGEEQSILELAGLVARTVGYRGRIVLDATKPDGTPRKLLDVSRLRSMGWVPMIGLPEGIARAYEEFQTGAQRGVAA